MHSIFYLVWKFQIDILLPTVCVAAPTGGVLALVVVASEHLPVVYAYGESAGRASSSKCSYSSINS